MTSLGQRIEIPDRAARQTFEMERYVFTGLAVASIWLGVALASIFAPDMVTGSEQEHLPIAAATAWLWGGVATGLVLLASGVSRRSDPGSYGVWLGLFLGVGAIWLAVAAVSIFAPEMVTGTDPTRIPLGALVSPVAGMIATAFACVFVAGAPRR